VPLSDAELRKKLTWLLEGLAEPETPARILELCKRLSTIEDVEELVKTCQVRQAEKN
jgi:hypothetical protein